MADTEMINLDTLNVKQRLKEYKATQKDVKSKDLVAKGAALKKLTDIRYLTEGGCFFPLVSSILPKKKTLDVSKLCLDHLLLFLNEKGDINKAQSPVVASLGLTLSSEGNLSVLKILSDVFNFREEIKKPKKKKVKNAPVEEEEVIPEDPMYEILRRGALKSFYHIVSALYAESAVVSELQVAVAQVENLVTVLCDLILSLKANVESDKVDVRCKAVQDGMYALFILVFVLRHNPVAVLSFIKSDLLTSLQQLSHEKKFTFYCIQILEILSWQKEGIVVLNVAPMQILLLELLANANKRLNEPAEDAAPANAKDKKKEPPKKGAPIEVAEDPMEKLDAITIDPNRGDVASIKLIAKIFIAIGSQLNATIDLAVVKEVATIVSKTLLNPVTYEVTRAPLHAPLDEPLADAVDTLCIAVGTLGAVSAEVRGVASDYGALSAVLTVLLNSQVIVAGPPPAAPATGAKGAPAVEAVTSLSADEALKQKQRVTQLRRVAEKAVLNLVTESLESPLDDALAGHVSHGMQLPVRWTSCFARKSDEAAFSSGDATLAAKLVDLVNAPNDEDLAGRGVRILAAILHGHHHPVELIESKELHKSLIKPLAQLVQQRSVSLVASEIQQEIRASAAAKRRQEEEAAALATAKLAAEADEETSGIEEITSALERSTIEATPVVASTIDNAAVETKVLSAPRVDVLLPTVPETLFLALSVVELFLIASPDSVNAFTSTERIEVLSDLLRVLGPVSGAAFAPSASGVAAKVVEFEAVLHDPRRHNWSSLNPSDYFDTVLVRPLILDVLSLIAGAGQKYRTYEAELPVPPCEPVPACVSPCEEAAMITCKLSADACCSILLSQAEFCWAQTPSGTVLNVKPAPARVLIASVQDAALSLLRNIANCGVRGVAGAVGGIASTGFNFLAQSRPAIDFNAVDNANSSETGKTVLSERCSMSDFAHLLAQQDASSKTTLQQLMPSGYVWKRPQFFDEVFNTQDVLTLPETVLSNHQIWPFIVFTAAFVGTLANPATSPAAAALTLDGLSAATRLPVLDDHSQPVITDAVSATFLSLGGGVVLSGLLSRYGNLPADIRPAGEQLAFYLFNRGHRRDSFWKDWELSHREEVVLDPKTGKPIPKKDDKKAKEKPVEKKKDPKAVAEVPPAVPEVELNLESTEEFPDPNHGPSAALWTKLINVGADDLHEQCPAVSPLISLVQGGKSELAVFLINHGAQVNDIDGTGHTALMYGLLMNDDAVVSSLVTKNADSNIIDLDRNPTVKYAILGLSNEDIDCYLTGHNHNSGDASLTELLGRPKLLPTLLNSSMDFQVAGPRGQSPIMMALGLGEITVRLGGHLVRVQNASYNHPDQPVEQVHVEVENLIAAGADVNFCNVAGAVPLHIAAAHGDLQLMDVLLKHGANPNAQDNAGFLPIHYLAACCPENALAGFDLLFKFSSHRHVDRMVYSDYRTGASQEEKDRMELERFMTKTYAETISPSVIGKKRLTPYDILHSTTDANFNVLQLCFAAPVLLADHAPLKAFLCRNKERRMALALHILQLAEKLDATPAALIKHTDANTGLTSLHAAALLFQGLTPQIYLTDREKRAKRVRKFVSSEARILDYLFTHLDGEVTNAVCTYPLKQLGLETWSLMHPVVFWDNSELASVLLQKGFRLDDTEMVHFLAQFCPSASEALVQVIVNAANGSPRHKALLNDRGTLFSTARPLHIAVRCRNLHVVRALAACVKVDLNAVDDVTGRTALFEACELGAINLVQAFIPGADRLDLFAGSVVTGGASPNQHEGETTPAKIQTPLNVVLEKLDVFILQELIFKRKNDVIQQLLQVHSTGEPSSQGESATAVTLLYALERDNCDMARELGIALPPLLEAMSSSQKIAALDAQASSKGESGKVLHRPEDMPHGSDSPGPDGRAFAEVEYGDMGEGEEGHQVPVEANGDKTMEAPVTAENLADLDVIEQSGIGGRVLKDKKKAMLKFRKSNEVLRVVIELVNGSGIVGEKDHFHPYYFSGNLQDK